jgi:hypothetical protein
VGRGHCQQRIDNASGTHPRREHKACKHTSKKSGIGDRSGHGRTPVTPSNGFPSPTAVQIGCLHVGGIRPLCWMSGNCIAIAGRHSPTRPNIKHICLADYGVPENVFNEAHFAIREGVVRYLAADVICCRPKLYGSIAPTGGGRIPDLFIGKIVRSAGRLSRCALLLAMLSRPAASVLVRYGPPL